MTTPTITPMNHLQEQRVRVLTARFDCGNDFQVEAFDAGRVRVRMGAQKGRVRTFLVNLDGSVRA